MELIEKDIFMTKTIGEPNNYHSIYHTIHRSAHSLLKIHNKIGVLIVM